MKVLITGANGFVGKNLVATLQDDPQVECISFTRESSFAFLEQATRECDFVFHLAGVNRSNDSEEFDHGNVDLTKELLLLLEKHGNKVPVLFSSTIHAGRDDAYGRSKEIAEKLLFDYSKRTGAPVFVYRLANLFGKWSRPNYNTVVATFCHNIARDIPIQVNAPEANLSLCYIDDVLTEYMTALEGSPTQRGEYCFVDITHSITLGDLAKTLSSFRESRENLYLPYVGDALTHKLYATYLSFLPEDDFAYPLTMHNDHRGSFTEIIRTYGNGQVSVNVSKPGVTKGDHWHHTKNEKFLVVSGEGLIRFRKIGDHKIIDYKVDARQHMVVDIPTGYTHSIINTGITDMVTLMWASECFDPEHPDTMPLKVEE